MYAIISASFAVIIGAIRRKQQAQSPHLVRRLPASFTASPQPRVPRKFPQVFGVPLGLPVSSDREAMI
jgi:hypothetical protein